MTVGTVIQLPLRFSSNREELVMPQMETCPSWCVFHCVMDDGEITFCMGEDLPIDVYECGGTGYVGLVHFPGEVPKVDLGLASVSCVMTIVEAERVAQAIMRQVARARGQEDA
jgi:hypothetical protein